MMTITGEHLWKSYGGTEVLRDVSLTVTESERVCLMAPSGSGKTTLLRLILGLEPPEGGNGGSHSETSEIHAGLSA